MGLLGTFVHQKKLTGVVRVSHEFNEESGGYQNEQITDDIVCLKDGEPRRIKVSWYRRTMGTTDRTAELDEPISREEYERLKALHGVLDTDAYEAVLTQRRELERQIEELTPKCPTCQNLMEQRSGKYGTFWSCSAFPRCKGTRKLSAAVSDRLSQLGQKVFDLQPPF